MQKTIPAIFFIVLYFFSTMIHGDEINTDMGSAADLLSTLIPLIYDDTKFKAPANQDTINRELDKLIDLFNTQSRHLKSRSLTFAMSVDIILNHLKQAKSTFNDGHYAISQYMLSSTPALCSTCHVQDGAHSSYSGLRIKNSFANDISYAEFLYSLRNYELAETYYLKHLAQASVKKSRFQFIKPMERLLTIELGIRQDPERARKLLKRHAIDTDISDDIRKTLQDWLIGIDNIEHGLQTDIGRLEAVFKSLFSENYNTSHQFLQTEKDRPAAIWLRAKLFNVVHYTDDIADMPKALYFLSVIDRIIGNEDPYSFANMYLKQCIISYPNSEFAKICFQEYKSHIAFYYGGSGGDYVPEKLKAELYQMETALGNAPKTMTAEEAVINNLEN